MFHKSQLEQYKHQFPHDAKGRVPHPEDRWQDMQFEVEGMDPHEEGISAEEQARRIEYLNKVWWPNVIQQVEDERQRLADLHGEAFMAHWRELIHDGSHRPHGYSPEGLDVE